MHVQAQVAPRSINPSARAPQTRTQRNVARILDVGPGSSGLPAEQRAAETSGDRAPSLLAAVTGEAPTLEERRDPRSREACSWARARSGAWTPSDPHAHRRLPS